MQKTFATDSRKRSLLYGFYVAVDYRRRNVYDNVTEGHCLCLRMLEAYRLICRPVRKYRGAHDSYALGNYDLFDTRAEPESVGADTDKNDTKKQG